MPRTYPEIADNPLQARNDGNRVWPAGFEPHADRKRAPRGWRRNRRYGLLIPSDTALGRGVRAELDALPACHTARHYLKADAGMPSMHLAGDPLRGTRLLSPGVALLPGPWTLVDGSEAAGLVWVRWNTHLTAEFDAALPDHWERVALSAYFKLVESGRDPFQPREPVDERVP